MWINIKDTKNIEFAFDHAEIFQDYLKWKKNGGTYWSGKDD